MLSHQRIILAFVVTSLISYAILFREKIPQSLNVVEYIQNFTDTAHRTNSTSTSGSDISAVSTGDKNYPTGIPNTWGSKGQDLEDFENSAHTANTLRALCRETQWVDGLWLHCHSYCGVNHTSVCGGLNNARNRIQTCIRLAIDAGVGIILPSATTRDEKNLVKTDDKTVCADVFWNMQHLQTTLSAQCPQLQVRMCDDRSGIPDERVIESPKRAYLERAHTNGTFRTLLKETVANSNVTGINSQHPAIVNYGDSYIGWNYKESGELITVRKALFKTLEFNRKLLELSSMISSSPQLQKGAFIGVHLRGENDWPANFGTVNDQMRLYVAEMENIRASVSYQMNTVYVSCGDPTPIQWFRDILNPLGYIVYDKWTLLAEQPDILAQIDALAFDQKAIVEYQTLVDARFFLGILTSSMSSLIAYARSVDDIEDYFETHVFPGSSKSGLNRGYPGSPIMKGNMETKLIAVSGVDIMDAFP